MSVDFEFAILLSVVGAGIIAEMRSIIIGGVPTFWYSRPWVVIMEAIETRWEGHFDFAKRLGRAMKRLMRYCWRSSGVFVDHAILNFSASISELKEVLNSDSWPLAGELNCTDHLHRRSLRRESVLELSIDLSRQVLGLSLTHLCCRWSVCWGRP